jgi:cyclopropane-fatty-acyl-phospholipid synthase
VRLIDSQGSIEAGANTGPRVEVEVRCPRFYSQVAFGGTIGAAEAYMAGMWQCDDLPGLIGILARNSDILQRVEGGWALPARPARKILHWMNRNSLRGSRRNIAAHYDLGNDFYRLFLDESLTYSSALFREPGMSLAQAQQAKIDRLCRLLRLSKNNHLLEIGTGWGALAIHAAKHYGSRVTTATISRQQFEYASKRVEEEGLSDRIKLEFQDYRRLRGKYDRIVSVEMIEAVGHRNVPRYFRKLGQLSTDDALVALQAITVPDQLYRKHVRRVDFIKRYIFPGSCLTSVGAMCRAAAKQTRLRPVDLADLTEHYARTLEIWRLSLRENWQAAGRLGLSQEFLRMWEFYFAYCQGAFAQRYIGDVQILFSGPLCRVESICSRP